MELCHPGRGPAANVPLELLRGRRRPDAGQYRGEYPGLNQSAHFQVYLGDAWTDPLALSVTPLPVVEIEAEVVPPVYARQSADEVQKLPRGMRQFAVLAGSEVRLTLDSDRPLKAAEATIAGRHAAARCNAPDATASDGAGSLDAGHRRHAAGIRRRGNVVCDSGSRCGRPDLGRSRSEGIITIEPDQPPGIMADTKTPIVLPTGSPNIHYEATDDHALGCIWLTWEATSGEPPKRSKAATEKREGRIEVCRFPPEASPRSREGDYPLALQSLPLKPGDTLKVTFHVSDYRGPAPAATVDADPPLVFQVTDLRGFEASMYEADQKSAGVLGRHP